MKPFSAFMPAPAPIGSWQVDAGTNLRIPPIRHPDLPLGDRPLLRAYAEPGCSEPYREVKVLTSASIMSDAVCFNGSFKLSDSPNIRTNPSIAE